MTTLYHHRVWTHRDSDYWVSANIQGDGDWRNAELSISDGDHTAFFVLEYGHPNNYQNAMDMLTLLEGEINRLRHELEKAHVGLEVEQGETPPAASA